MKNQLSLFLASIAASSTLWAEPQCPEFMWDVGAGWRQDHFRWTISGPDKTPNVLSQVKWDDLQMFAAGGQARYVGTHHYVFQVSGDYGHIYKGHAKDTDYASDDKEDPFSKVTSNAGKGHVYDLSGAVGYQLISTGRRVLVTFLAGYSYDRQQLHMYDGDQHLGDNPGPIHGLDSSYTAQWFGPWLGIEMDTRVECNASLYASFAWHFPKFKAKGKWNLRDDFLDGFHQSSSGYGYDVSLGFSWDYCPNWGIGVLAKYRLFHTRGGSDRATILSGGDLIDVHTKLTSCHWDASSVYLTLFGRF